MMKCIGKIILYGVPWVLGILPSILSAQKVEVSVNKNNFIIGEQVSYGLKVFLPAQGYDAFFQIPDSIPHFEILARGEVQKSSKGEFTVEQILTITSFDSGRWAFPSIPIILKNNNNQTEIASPLLMFQVGYSPTDTTGIYDIRSVKSIPHSAAFWVYWLVGVLLTLLIGLLVWRLWLNRKKVTGITGSSVIPPLEEALAAYNRLEQQHTFNKQWYSEGSEIFKHYLSRKFKLDIGYLTTGELMVWLERRIPGVVQGTEVSAPLRLCDAVKYAKFQTTKQENENTIASFRKAIKWIDARVVLM
ncbi:MAG: DUF4381 family protein [Ferruginibacter sp.]|nr:DUF4381 family protein [Ferruginibacter sp.]